MADSGYGGNEISRIAWEGRQKAAQLQKSTEDVNKTLAASNFPIKQRRLARHKKADS